VSAPTAIAQPSPYDAETVTLARRALDALGVADAPGAFRFINDIAGEPSTAGYKTALVYHLIGLVSLYLDETSRAVEAFETAHKLAPDIRDHLEALAALYARLGRVVDALFYGKMAVTAKRRVGIPGVLPVWLGSFEQHFYRIEDQPLQKRAARAALKEDWAATEKYFRQSVEVDTEDAGAWRGLALALRRLHRPHEALDALIALHRLVPDDIDDIAALGDTMALLGVWDQAAECARHAAARRPGDIDLAWLPVRTLLADPATSRTDAAAAIAAWSAGATAAIEALTDRPACEPLKADRRLRVGLVSSCWQDGGGLDLIVPLLNALPRHTVELHVYADGYARTPLARRLQTAALSWQEIGELDDETTAYILGNDRLDVLIDCDGPHRRRRHALFLYRPVPLMLSLGDLPETTQYAGFDAVLGDNGTYPEATDADRLIRVEGVNASLPADLALLTTPVEKRPAPGIAFGLVSGPGRITREAAALWTRLLGERHEARLLLSPARLGGPRGAEAVQAMFQGTGVERQVAVEQDEGYLGIIDVLLDPPGNISGDALVIHAAAGIPVVTMPGVLPSSRVLGAWLARIGLGDWVTSDEPSYVAAARAAALPDARRRLGEAVRQECAEGVRRRALALETALRSRIMTGGSF
jgi:predicted O-linked N-acetylglucosamine transferase (SPINDLY family)